MPQFDTSTYESQIFWLIVFFGALYLFFSRYAVPRISQIVTERRQRINDRMSDIDRIHSECEEVLALAKKLRSNAHAEADALRRKAAEEAEKEYQSAMDRVKSEVEQMVSDANAQIEKLYADVEAELEKSVTEVSADMISHTTSIKVPGTKLRKAVENRISAS